MVRVYTRCFCTIYLNIIVHIRKSCVLIMDSHFELIYAQRQYGLELDQQYCISQFKMAKW